MEQVIYKKILVALDGSKYSQLALPHAQFLAKKLNAKLYLLSVIESIQQEVNVLDPVGLTQPLTAINFSSKLLIDKESKRISKQLNKIKKDLEKDKLKVQISILEGSAEAEIIDYTKEKKIDLLIISSQKKSEINKFLLGSVTDYLIKHASCPVLLIKANTD